MLPCCTNNTATSKAIYKELPISSSINVWGNEIYFEIPVAAKTEPEAKTVVNIGDLAYYSPMKAFCIFFGPTPMSDGDQPVAAGPVNVFGAIKDLDIELLVKCVDGATVIINRA